MAIRMARAVGGTPESWLRMQEALDLWIAETKFKNNPALAPKALAA
jgi:plasmid maintenance system antidote protein VapI